MSVFLADEQAESVSVDQLHRIAESILDSEGYPRDAEVNLLLVSDDEIASYNSRFLDREGPTDVLAFPVEELIPGVVPDVQAGGPPLVLGDVVIAPSYVRRQAESLGVEFEDEIALMVTHGILHLLGYDHDEDEDAERMEGRERALLESVGRKRR